ncbi:hypothetical protein FOZ63_025372 [Perkinsus olseni]|uniref:Uncharacterized protein n=1 Tax=Perkinsus olseni TaxID=32597 RepID=A0A7J6RK25_PEROL|nr:hypothetical protein FOZ63_025372 [Perkinsus olseni]
MARRCTNRIFVSFAYILMSTLSTDDRPILTDHPAGCNGGLGPLVGSTIRVQDSTCVYGLQDRTVDGLNHRKAGVILESNDLAYEGNLKIEVNIVEGAADSADPPNVTVDITGLAHMLFHHHNGMNFTRHVNPDDILFNGTDYGSAYPVMASRVKGYLPDYFISETPWFSIQDVATANGMNLYYTVDTVSRSKDLVLSVENKISMNRVDGGWDFDVAFKVLRGGRNAPLSYVGHFASGTLLL